MSGKPIDRFRAQTNRQQWVQPENGVSIDFSAGQMSDVVEVPIVPDPWDSDDINAISDRHPSSTALSKASRHPPANLVIPKDVVSKSTSSRVTSQVIRGVKFVAVPLAWLCLLAFCGGTGIAAFTWLATIPPLPNCGQLQSLPADADRLYCAEQSARSGKPEAILAGLTLVEPWSADHPLHSRVQRLVKDWSKTLLAIARNRASQNDMEGAIAIAQKIPKSSPLSKEAQTAIKSWRKDSSQGQALEASIQAALKMQNWQGAQEQIRAFAQLDSDQWQPMLTRLRQQLLTEQLARRQLQQIRRLSVNLATANPAFIGRLISQIEQISSDSFARSDAEADLNRLSQALLTMIDGRLVKGDIPGAIAMAQWLPQNMAIAPGVQELRWISQAQTLVSLQTPDGLLSLHLLRLWEGLSQLRQVSNSSPVYTQATALIPQLENRIQDCTQLQIASSMAALGQIATFQIAIQMAQSITPDRPQRLYAQTLIAQWRKDIQRVEDRPLLARSQRLAQAGTPPKLKAAIAQAKQIRPGRALYAEAQAAIVRWTKQIQTIEDRPFLNQARQLARQKKLAEAIKVAAKIRPGRALYQEAQTAMRGWTTQMQLAEDRPIMNQANGLADRGSLSAAIELAYQIAPGRALYGEAQTAIARWIVQRDAIRRATRPDSNDSPASPDRLSPDRSPTTYPSTAPELPPP